MLLSQDSTKNLKSKISPHSPRCFDSTAAPSTSLDISRIRTTDVSVLRTSALPINVPLICAHVILLNAGSRQNLELVQERTLHRRMFDGVKKSILPDCINLGKGQIWSFMYARATNLGTRAEENFGVRSKPTVTWATSRITRIVYMSRKGQSGHVIQTGKTGKGGQHFRTE
jgi:hypothetical protein